MDKFSSLAFNICPSRCALDTFTDKIKNISAQDIQNAFARLINTDKLILLICSWAVYLYNQPTRVQKFQVAR
jgi:hypothetical protein